MRFVDSGRQQWQVNVVDVHTYVRKSLNIGANPKFTSIPSPSSPLSCAHRFRSSRRGREFLPSCPCLMDYAQKRDDVQATETMSAPSLPPKYVMLDNNQNLKPPPQRRNLPPYHSYPPKHHKSGGNWCLKCICGCYCCLFFLIVIFTILAYVCYASFKPGVPNYNIENVDVKDFHVLPDFTLDSQLTVTVKADNPNNYITIKYDRYSSVNVLYAGKTICSGKIPEFEQPYKNVSRITMPLQGKTEFNAELQGTLMADKKAGKIPLLILVQAPIVVSLGTFPLKQVVVKVNCNVFVDNLEPGQKVGILSKKCAYAWS